MHTKDPGRSVKLLTIRSASYDICNKKKEMSKLLTKDHPEDDLNIRVLRLEIAELKLFIALSIHDPYLLVELLHKNKFATIPPTIVRMCFPDYKSIR